MSVKRYDISKCMDNSIDEEENGQYVLYSDYAASRAEVERLSKDLRDVWGWLDALPAKPLPISPLGMMRAEAMAALSAQPAPEKPAEPCPHTCRTELFTGGGDSVGMFCDDCHAFIEKARKGRAKAVRAEEEEKC